jgi:hypothetical protein
MQDAQAALLGGPLFFVLCTLINNPFLKDCRVHIDKEKKPFVRARLISPAHPHLPGFRARDARDEALVSYLPYTALDIVRTVCNLRWLVGFKLWSLFNVGNFVYYKEAHE